MADVEIKDLHKIFDRTEAVRGIDLSIKDKEFVILVGPSGCGKSTVLRMIAGLEEVTEGDIYIGDKLVNDIPPKDRDIAMVFQSYALYPHMTVEENMSFGLRMNNAPKTKINKKVGEAAKILQLTELMKRKPASLSGGQRRRVEIARSLLHKPKLLLLDEPTVGLDIGSRQMILKHVKSLCKKNNLAVLWATHLIDEIDKGEKVIIIDKGKVLETGDVSKIIKKTKTKNIRDAFNKLVGI